VFQNAITFNGENHFVGKLAVELLTEFENEVLALQEKVYKDCVKRIHHSPASSLPSSCSSSSSSSSSSFSFSSSSIAASSSSSSSSNSSTCCPSNPCLLCGERCLKFETPILFCHGGNCHQRIRKNTFYFITPDGSALWCQKCHSSLSPILIDYVSHDGNEEKPLLKKHLLKRKFDEEIVEEWIQCYNCSLYYHSICSLYKKKLNEPSSSSSSSCFQYPALSSITATATAAAAVVPTPRQRSNSKRGGMKKSTSTTTISASSSLDSEDGKEKRGPVIYPVSAFLCPFCILEKNAYFSTIPDEESGEGSALSLKKKGGKDSESSFSPRSTVSRTVSPSLENGNNYVVKIEEKLEIKQALTSKLDERGEKERRFEEENSSLEIIKMDVTIEEEEEEVNNSDTEDTAAFIVVNTIPLESSNEVSDNRQDSQVKREEEDDDDEEESTITPMMIIEEEMKTNEETSSLFFDSSQTSPLPPPLSLASPSPSLATSLTDNQSTIQHQQDPYYQWKASTLPSSKLSVFLEEMVRCTLLSSGYSSEVASSITIRVTSNTQRSMEVPKALLDNIKGSGRRGSVRLPEAMNYGQKCIQLFQSIDGIDVCLFCLYCHEFDNSACHPNASSVYIAYLDSIDYFRPITARSLVYQEIVTGYLIWSQGRGFSRCHIWACPPQRGDSFIFWCHPSHQKTPSRDRLNSWYNTILTRCKSLGVTCRISHLWELYFKKYNQRDGSLEGSTEVNGEGNSSCSIRKREAAKRSFVGSGKAKESSSSHVKKYRKMNEKGSSSSSSSSKRLASGVGIELTSSASSENVSLDGEEWFSIEGDSEEGDNDQLSSSLHPSLSSSSLSPSLSSNPFTCPPVFEGDYWVMEFLKLHRIQHQKCRLFGEQNSASNYRKCRDIIKSLIGRPHAVAFRQPVDPVVLCIPTYSLIVKSPMDLGTVREKVRSNIYGNVMEFVKDVRLTFSNAKLFNPEGHVVHIQANLLGIEFEKSLEQSFHEDYLTTAMDRPFTEFLSLCKMVCTSASSDSSSSTNRREKPPLKPSLSSSSSSLAIPGNSALPTTGSIFPSFSASASFDENDDEKKRNKLLNHLTSVASSDALSIASLNLLPLTPRVERRVSSAELTTTTTTAVAGRQGIAQRSEEEIREGFQRLTSQESFSLQRSPKSVIDDLQSQQHRSQSANGSRSQTPSLDDDSDSTHHPRKPLLPRIVSDESTPLLSSSNSSILQLTASSSILSLPNLNIIVPLPELSMTSFPSFGFASQIATTTAGSQISSVSSTTSFTSSSSPFNDNDSLSICNNSEMGGITTSMGRDGDSVMSGVTTIATERETMSFPFSHNNQPQVHIVNQPVTDLPSLTTHHEEQGEEEEEPSLELNNRSMTSLYSDLAKAVHRLNDDLFVINFNPLNVSALKAFSSLSDKALSLLASLSPDTSDPDPLVTSPLIDTRYSFLEICQFNHYQFDSLRRAKYSSLMMLYYLHNPSDQTYRPTCSSCSSFISELRWHCEICPHERPGTHYELCRNCKDKLSKQYCIEINNNPVTNSKSGGGMVRRASAMDGDDANSGEMLFHPHPLTPYRISLLR
jgi:hypothetical protein